MYNTQLIANNWVHITKCLPVLKHQVLLVDSVINPEGIEAMV